MYGLPEDVDLNRYQHVILSSSGSLLTTSMDIEPTTSHAATLLERHSLPSLDQRFSELLDLVPVDAAHCLGLGAQVPYPPVVLHLRVSGRSGEALAVFAGR